MDWMQSGKWGRCCRIKSSLANARLLFHPCTRHDNDDDNVRSSFKDDGGDDDDDGGSVMMIVLERHCGSELELLSRARDLRMKIYQCTRQYPF